MIELAKYGAAYQLHFEIGFLFYFNCLDRKDPEMLKAGNCNSPFLSYLVIVDLTVPSNPLV